MPRCGFIFHIRSRQWERGSFCCCFFVARILRGLLISARENKRGISFHLLNFLSAFSAHNASWFLPAHTHLSTCFPPFTQLIATRGQKRVLFLGFRNTCSLPEQVEEIAHNNVFLADLLFGAGCSIFLLLEGWNLFCNDKSLKILVKDNKASNLNKQLCAIYTSLSSYICKIPLEFLLIKALITIINQDCLGKLIYTRENIKIFHPVFVLHV